MKSPKPKKYRVTWGDDPEDVNNGRMAEEFDELVDAKRFYQQRLTEYYRTRAPVVWMVSLHYNKDRLRTKPIHFDEGDNRPRHKRKNLPS